MPFVRISLSAKHSQETRNHISTAVHTALIREFNIPEDDFFHIIEPLDATQIKFPKMYVGIVHTENIVFIQIIAAQGRSLEQKQKLYAQIAARISESTSITPNNVIIILTENNGRENWSFGNGEIYEPKHI